MFVQFKLKCKNKKCEHYRPTAYNFQSKCFKQRAMLANSRSEAAGRDRVVTLVVPSLSLLLNNFVCKQIKHIQCVLANLLLKLKLFLKPRF